MSKKGITLKIAVDDVGFFGAVLNCAIRYCIERETYMPGLVPDWIMKRCNGILTKKTLAVMKRDSLRRGRLRQYGTKGARRMAGRVTTSTTTETRTNGTKRDNRLWRPECRGVQATFVLCEECGEGYEADREHVCRAVNSYPVEWLGEFEYAAD